MEDDRQSQEGSRGNRPGAPAHRGAAGGRSSLSLRSWAILLLGVFAAGGAAVDFLSSGDHWRATLAMAACAGCLGGIAWALDDRS